MAYTELKEKLERLLTEDLSNRSSLQDVRRNLFLNSEGTKVQQQLIAEKQNEISSLSLLVEKKKTILQLKDEQINTIKEKATDLEEKLASAESTFAAEKNILLEKISSLEQLFESETTIESKVEELNAQNEGLSVRIRELLFQLELQNTELEGLKQIITNQSQTPDQTELLEEKIAENVNLQERNDLLFASEQQLKVLVASQNKDIENFVKQTNSFKKHTEDIAAGWQMQQDQLIMDNANLLAEMVLVKEASIINVTETGPLISSEELTILKTANADLLAELALAKEAALINTTETAPGITSEELTNLKTANADLLAELELTREDSATKVSGLNTELTSLKSEKETWSATNTGLLAEITSLKESATQNSTPVNESLSEEQIAEIRSEKEHLATELEAIKHELNITTQNREEKIISLQNEIGTLQNQLISLSNSLNQETEQKNLIGTQVEQLTNLVTEKEQQLSGMSNNTADEEFVDKLMQQINFLSDQKNSLETMYHDSVAELSLTKANLASITQLVDGQKDSISGLEETNKHVKLAQTLVLQVTDKTEAKQAINELVREIDRCIALLSE